MLTKFSVPAKLISEANQREHWAVKHTRKKKQQMAVLWTWNSIKPPLSAPPWHIRLIRVGPRKLDPDNCAGSMKHVQDKIAEILGIDDGDETMVTWEYAQRKGAPKEYSLDVEIRPREDKHD